MHFVSYETNLRAEETQPNTPVFRDSCMELFMQFAPETDPRYINIEVNPNGAAYCSCLYGRNDGALVDPADIALLQIRTKVFSDHWEIDYVIPTAFIQKYIPTYRHATGTKLRGNLYKCGCATDHPHYGCFSPIPTPQPDFHRPEHFAEFELV